MTINSEELLQSAKVYSFQTLHSLGMTPTDIDAAHESSGRFTFFEFKCKESGKQAMKAGQRKFWESLLRELGDKAIMLLCEHGDVRNGVPDPLKSLNSFQVWYWDGNKVSKTARVSPDGGKLEWVLSTWRSERRTELRNWLAGCVE